MKYRIDIEPLAGCYVVALKDQVTGDPVKVFTVNASAYEMLHLYKEGVDVETIARTMSEKYCVPANCVRDDIEALIAKLK